MEPLKVQGNFGASIVRRPNARCPSTTGEIVENLTVYSSVCLTPIDGNVRVLLRNMFAVQQVRLLETSHGLFSAGLSGLIRGDKVTSVCLTPKNRNTAILLRSVFAV